MNVGSHIRTSNISDMLKKAIEKAGFNWRPYAFRRYFSTKMLHAEEDGMPHSFLVLSLFRPVLFPWPFGYVRCAIRLWFLSSCRRHASSQCRRSNRPCRQG
jgi:hypothetical protein